MWRGAVAWRAWVCLELGESLAKQLNQPTFLYCTALCVCVAAVNNGPLLVSWHQPGDQRNPFLAQLSVFQVRACVMWTHVRATASCCAVLAMASGLQRDTDERLRRAGGQLDDVAARLQAVEQVAAMAASQRVSSGGGSISPQSATGMAIAPGAVTMRMMYRMLLTRRPRGTNATSLIGLPRHRGGIVTASTCTCICGPA